MYSDVADSPLTHQPGGPVDAPVNKIAKRENVKPEQVLLAWAKSKGAVVVTYVCSPLGFHSGHTHRIDSSSTKKERLEGYLDAGDLSTSHLPTWYTTLDTDVCWLQS
jgi:hypothetical protein